MLFCLQAVSEANEIRLPPELLNEAKYPSELFWASPHCLPLSSLVFPCLEEPMEKAADILKQRSAEAAECPTLRDSWRLVVTSVAKQY